MRAKTEPHPPQLTVIVACLEAILGAVDKINTLCQQGCSAGATADLSTLTIC